MPSSILAAALEVGAIRPTRIRGGGGRHATRPSGSARPRRPTPHTWVCVAACCMGLGLQHAACSYRPLLVRHSGGCCMLHAASRIACSMQQHTSCLVGKSNGTLHAACYSGPSMQQACCLCVIYACMCAIHSGGACHLPFCLTDVVQMKAGFLFGV